MANNGLPKITPWPCLGNLHPRTALALHERVLGQANAALGGNLLASPASGFVKSKRALLEPSTADFCGTPTHGMLALFACWRSLKTAPGKQDS